MRYPHATADYGKDNTVLLNSVCLSLGLGHSSSPGFLSSLFSVASCMAPAPLKLRPYGAIQITCIIIIIYNTKRDAILTCAQKLT